MIRKHHEHLQVSHVAALVMVGLLLAAGCFWCSAQNSHTALEAGITLSLPSF